MYIFVIFHLLNALQDYNKPFFFIVLKQFISLRQLFQKYFKVTFSFSKEKPTEASKLIKGINNTYLQRQKSRCIIALTVNNTPNIFLEKK